MESPCSLFKSWAMASVLLYDAHRKSVKAAKESLKESNPACSLTFAHPTNHSVKRLRILRMFCKDTEKMSEV